MKSLTAFLAEPLSPDQLYVLGCSGGADSVFLGEALFQAGFKRIIVAHFNHALRGAESEEDEAFVRQLAKKWGYEFISEKWAHPEKSEEKARQARHDFLEKIRRQEEAKATLLAHHQDDQAETILFNFLRGTGVRGLGGMAVFDRKRKIIRPLLGLTKAEILAFLTKEQIPYRTDSSNADSAFARNFLRNEVLPLIASRFSENGRALARTGEIFRELTDFLIAKAQRWLKKNRSPQDGFVRSKFLALPRALQAEVLALLWRPRALDFAQQKTLADFIATGKSGKKIALTGHVLTIFGENFFISEE